MALKIKTILVFSNLLGACVFAQSGATIGVFGVSRISIPPAGGVNLVGFSFSSSSSLFLEDVFGTNQLTQTTLLPTFADLVYIWNGSTYDIYFQKTNGQFYDGANPFGAPKTTQISSGTAVFLQSPSSATLTNYIYFSGDVLVTDFEGQSYSNLTTIANPYPTDLDLNGTNVDWSAATSGFLPTQADNVFIWNPDKAGGPGYDVYFLKSDLKWYEATLPFPLGNPVIPSGGGAFYQAKNSFTNAINRPFGEL